MIHIDFLGGAHGNFLEFVCNLAADVETIGTPFNSLGASHNKRYLGTKLFYSDHYSFGRGTMIYNNVIAIKINVDDLLPLSQISLLRAADYGYDNNQLEVNTYNKLNNENYRCILDTLLKSFFHTQIEQSYSAVKDESWPTVTSMSEFLQLPDWIQKECKDIHNLELLELTEENPDCPRHILRKFFQIGFDDPSKHGFITQQHLMQYDKKINVYIFPYSAFYDTHQFLDQIEKIASWAKINYTKQKQVEQLHIQFLEKQPYKDSKNKCDQIVQQLINNTIQPPAINLIEEAYVNSMLEKHGYECRY